jgi:hypothetical protein
MGKSNRRVTISLDGLVADQNGYAGRLDPELAALRPPLTPRTRSSRLVQSSWGEGRPRWRISRQALHRNKAST